MPSEVLEGHSGSVLTIIADMPLQRAISGDATGRF